MIKYSSGYKYQLKELYKIRTGITLPQMVSNGAFLELSRNGWLRISYGYSWDGPSGPTIDTKTFMRGSLVHDALYQLMREGFLPQKYRKEADELLRKICLEDGMSKIRAWYVYESVQMFAGKYASAGNTTEILSAP